MIPAILEQAVSNCTGRPAAPKTGVSLSGSTLPIPELIILRNAFTAAVRLLAPDTLHAVGCSGLNSIVPEHGHPMPTLSATSLRLSSVVEASPPVDRKTVV